MDNPCLHVPDQSVCQQTHVGLLHSGQRRISSHALTAAVINIGRSTSELSTLGRACLDEYINEVAGGRGLASTTRIEELENNLLAGTTRAGKDQSHFTSCERMEYECCAPPLASISPPPSTPHLRPYKSRRLTREASMRRRMLVATRVLLLLAVRMLVLCARWSQWHDSWRVLFVVGAIWVEM